MDPQPAPAPAPAPATTAAPPAGGAPPAGPLGGMGSFLILMAFMVGMFFLMTWPDRRQRKKHKSMLDALKKNDRVVTVGGLHGVVVAVADDAVTLRIDDNQDVRVKFARGAIQTVHAKDREKDKEEERK